MELVLPQNYVEVTEEEMMYLDGGISVPKWAVAGGINAGVNLAAAWITGGGGIALAKAAIRAVGQRAFTNTLKSALGRFIATRIATTIAGTVVGFVLGSGGYSVGGAVANYWDARDRNRNNGWIDL